jgi:hypothetical protein
MGNLTSLSQGQLGIRLLVTHDLAAFHIAC